MLCVYRILKYSDISMYRVASCFFSIHAGVCNTEDYGFQEQFCLSEKAEYHIPKYMIQDSD